MIQAQKLSKVFPATKKTKEVRAVNAISFECKPGQIYGLLGANGAGKTTTLRILATILEPTSGTAKVAGYDIVEEPEKVRENVGFLSTSTALYDRLTARELVEYFGRLHGMDGDALHKSVETLFAALDMNGFRDRRCEKLSTGMKQKVSIARTLVHDPPVMIFDEPTMGLDVMAARHRAIHPPMPRARQDRDFFHARNVRSDKAMRQDWYHPRRKHSRRRHARGTARAARHAGFGRHLRQSSGR